MGELYFVRHGQASYGTDDYDRLSPLGHQQSDWLGQHLAAVAPDFDRIVCGTLRRHRETLNAVQKHLRLANVRFDARFNEMGYAVMEDEYCLTNGTAVPGNGEALAALFTRVMHAWKNQQLQQASETFNAFQARIIAGVAEAAATGQRTLIISSGGPVGITMRAVLGLDIHALIELILLTHNASYSKFRVINGRLHLLQFNAIPHLETPERSHAQTYL